MARLSSASPRGSQKPGRPVPLKLILSYVFDWVILIAFALVATYLSDIEPIKRPFSLDNATISFPFTEHETVPVAILFITNAAAPILIILVVTFIFVPGPTVPKGTPRSMIWRRKLWELHIGWLGMALAMCCCMFITNGLKNMFGKARPDLLDRCVPDMSNLQKYKIGAGLLVSPDICTQPDKSKLDDGFRSFPSGHASSSAAGLIYLSLFLASKFTITIPFIAPAGYPTDASYAAFPSRSTATVTGGNTVTPNTSTVSRSLPHIDDSNDPDEHAAANRIASHTMAVYAVRRQAAAPPLYLLGLSLLPTFAAVFIASSRWWDYRHHAFDIGSGFLIGTVSAFFAFRYYHMPISQGAGWAWGPRSSDKAFWGGLGSYSYATDRQKWYVRPGDEEEGTTQVTGRDEEEGTTQVTGRDVELGGMVPRVPTVPIVHNDSGESSAVTKLPSRVGTDKSSGS